MVDGLDPLCMNREALMLQIFRGAAANVFDVSIPIPKVFGIREWTLESRGMAVMKIIS